MISIEYSLMMTLLGFISMSVWINISKVAQACSIHLVSSTSLGRLVSTLKKFFSRFVKFQGSDLTVGCIDWNWDLRAILLVSNNLFNMDTPSLSVDGKYLASLTSYAFFNATSLDMNSVSLSDRN